MKNDDEVDDGDSMAAYGEGDTGKTHIHTTIIFIVIYFQIIIYKIHYHHEWHLTCYFKNPLDF